MNKENVLFSLVGVLLGFTDSPHQLGGLYNGDPGEPDTDGVYHHPCTVYSVGKDDL